MFIDCFGEQEYWHELEERARCYDMILLEMETYDYGDVCGDQFAEIAERSSYGFYIEEVD